MQRGDIGQVITQRSVVTLMPTLALPPLLTGMKRMMGTKRRAAAIGEGSHPVVAMMTWMEQTAYMHSVTFEVWHIAPDVELQRLVFDHLTERLEPLLPRSVSHWAHYDEDKARWMLLSSPHLSTVYDADHDRLERCWKLRGYRVPAGGNPV